MTSHRLLQRAASIGRHGTLGAVLLASAGCGSLLPAATPQPAFYTLDSAAKTATASTSVLAGVQADTALPLLVINLPQAAAGFNSAKIIYFRQRHQLEYYAHSEWVDTPARMLAPLLVAALAPYAQTGSANAVVPAASALFSAVVSAPSAVAADLTLETQLLRLQQDFGALPSQVRLTLRAHLIDSATRQVLASREYDQTQASTSEDARGGVDAAHRVVDQVLADLARWCTAAAAHWRPDDTRPGVELNLRVVAR